MPTIQNLKGNVGLRALASEEGRFCSEGEVSELSKVSAIDLGRRTADEKVSCDCIAEGKSQDQWVLARETYWDRSSSSAINQCIDRVRLIRVVVCKDEVCEGGVVSRNQQSKIIPNLFRVRVG